ncbi:unnamed protein product [marine sediment metagenome]|uniref:Uncharacterized protein n=1 Tax=marine sediment metagenome TaxID=412755 RepID=X1FR44_9ZZZZ
MVDFKIRLCETCGRLCKKIYITQCSEYINELEKKSKEFQERIKVKNNNSSNK